MTAGCVGGDGDQSDGQQASSEERPQQQTTGQNGSQLDTTTSTDNEVEDNSVAWIGPIPYDVYYDRPLDIAANLQTISMSPNTTPGEVTTPMPMVDTPEPDPMPMTPAVATGVVDWPTVIDSEVLNEEVKQLRNQLAANLQTVATFNREQESIQRDAVVLSALAAIAVVHPGELNWKEKAAHVRDLANSIFINASSTGREPFSACEIAFEQIETVLDGGPVPADLEADPGRSPTEVADRYDLMGRLNQTATHLKSNINSDVRLAEDVPSVVRELSVLAALAKLISQEGYGFAEESDYQTHISTFIDATLTARTGAQQESFEQFSQGLSMIQKACNDCHTQYAFGTDAGF